LAKHIKNEIAIFFYKNHILQRHSENSDCASAEKNMIFPRSAAFRCTVFKTRKDTATNTVRTIGQAFDVVHRITEIEKEKIEESKNQENGNQSTKSSPKKSLKSTKVLQSPANRADNTKGQIGLDRIDVF